jgi:hypothetical protein
VAESSSPDPDISSAENEVSRDTPQAAPPKPTEPRDDTLSDERGRHERVQDEPPPPRSVELTAFRAWQQPGLCVKGEAAGEAHDRLMSRFRVIDLDGRARFFVDPRLPEGAHLSLLAHLDEAERQARAELGLATQSPDVFAYQDTELLLAAACTNDDVVAYYDGALHVVVNRSDLRESVIHEYAHHALMTHGILGPTWAQEGIAMHVARETWWLTREWLARLTEQPFSIDAMERAIPYTLTSEQAVLFYVQAATMVACTVRGRTDGLAELVRSLGGAHSGSEVSYDVSAPQSPAALRACARTLSRSAAP